MHYSIFRRALPAVLGVIPFLAWVGCRSYEPSPIDWPRETAVWQAAPTNSLMTLEEATRCALVLNPEINALRVKKLSAQRESLAAGWWNDPALELDGLRILKDVPDPWIVGSSLSFALPLNGVPGLEKRAAECYARADALAVTSAERELIRSVEEAGLCLAHTEHVMEQMDAYLVRLRARDAQVRKLAEAGEIGRGEAERYRQELLRRETERARLRSKAASERLALLALAGLHPTAPVRFALDESVGHGEPQWPEDGALARHPRVLERLARVEASEEELHAEIRKQYPEVSLGPAFGNEEGENRLGLTLGLSLPLWNRNRRGIAHAEGGREEAKQAALAEWRRLVGQRHTLARQYEDGKELERLLREERLPAARAAAGRVELLFSKGEADTQSMAAADESVFEAEDELAEAHHTLDEIRIRAKVLAVE
jgi:outer membrane protein TolC